MVKKILIAFGALIFVLILVILLTIASSGNEPAPLLVANFVDLDKITRISKYRSCTGHVTVPQNEQENKRSMKHYFEVKPEYVGTDAVKIYSPYDGYVSVIRSEPGSGLEGELWIVPKRALPMLPPFGVWQFSVQHIIIKKDFRLGSEVKAGEIIGYAAIPKSNRATFDIVYAKQGLIPKKIDNWSSPFADLDSVFNHMSEEAFANYQQKGITSKEMLLISKEERDNKPCQYEGQGPYFINQEDPDNWVVWK